MSVNDFFNSKELLCKVHFLLEIAKTMNNEDKEVLDKE